MINSEVRVAVIGLRFGANHARLLSQMAGVRLAAVCDSDASRVQAVSEDTGAKAYASADEMLAAEALDAVVVALPAHLHLTVASAAIAHGCAVLVEKPLAPSLAEACELTMAARQAGVALMPGHLERFNPAVTEVVRRVRAGEIGRVLHLSARRMGPIVMRTQDVNVIHDTALHDIDAMRFITGLEVEHVYAEAHSGIIKPFEDSIAASLRLASRDGIGVIGSLEVNWLSPLLLRDLTILGEDGMFLLNYAAQSLRLVRPGAAPPARQTGLPWLADANPGQAGEPISITPQEPLQAELSAFIAALRSGTPMPVSDLDGLAAVAVADALTASARSGQPVKPQRVGL